MQSEAGTVVARQKVRDEACGPESWVCLRAGHPHINILKPKPLTSALVFDQLMRDVLSCKQCTMFICTRPLPLRFGAPSVTALRQRLMSATVFLQVHLALHKCHGDIDTEKNDAVYAERGTPKHSWTAHPHRECRPVSPLNWGTGARTPARCAKCQPHNRTAPHTGTCVSPARLLTSHEVKRLSRLSR